MAFRLGRFGVRCILASLVVSGDDIRIEPGEGGGVSAWVARWGETLIFGRDREDDFAARMSGSMGEGVWRG